MSGQQLRIHVSTLTLEKEILWAAVVLDNSLDPPILKGRVPLDGDVQEQVLLLVSRWFSPREAQYARWVGENEVPVLSHSKLTQVLGPQKGKPPSRALPASRKRPGTKGWSEKKVEALVKIHGAHCHWCGCALSLKSSGPRSATVEHLIPRSKKGTNDLENLRISCKSCNNKRGDRTGPMPSEGW